jgi:hypothetical protein
MTKEDRDYFISEVKRRLNSTARTPMGSPMITFMVIIALIEIGIYLLTKI